MSIIDTIAHLFHPRRSNNHRSRLLHAEAYLFLIAITMGFSIFIGFSGRINSELGHVLGYASDISVQDVVAQTNQQRQAGGLHSLNYNQTLSNAAHAKAQDMFNQQYWAHTSPQGVEPWSFISGEGYSYLSAGENLARDFMQTNDMMGAWMSSPTHRENIMSAKYDDIGVAVVNGVLEGIETTLVVQMFGKPRAVAQAPVPIIPQATAQENITDSEQAAASEPTTPVIQVEEEPIVSQDAEELKSDDLLLPESEFTDASTQPDQNDTSLDYMTPSSAFGETSMVSPLQLVKAFGVSMLLLLILTLIYDEYIAHQHRVARMVGKNLAHISFFITVLVVIVIFRGGFVG